MSYLKSKNTKVLGADVFIVQKEIPQPKSTASFELKWINNRGAKIWPGPTPHADLTDVFMCRFLAKSEVSHGEINQLLAHLESQGFEWVHVEKLLEVNGKTGFFA